MTVRFVRPVSRTAYMGRKFGFFALVLFLIAAVAHRFGPLGEPDFIAFVFLSAAIAAFAVPLCVIGLMRLWQMGAKGGLAAAQGLICASVPLAVIAIGLIAYLTLPKLHDVTSDTADPPAWIAEPQADQKWLPRAAFVTPADRRAQLSAFPALTGRRYEGALDRVYEGVRKALVSARIGISKNEGMQLVAPDISTRPLRDEQAAVPDIAPIPLPRPEPLFEQESGAPGDVLLQGETRTLVLGLRFDVIIRLREDAETTAVDIRVASRYGQHDLGISAEIAQDFLDRLDGELLGLAGG